MDNPQINTFPENNEGNSSSAGIGTIIGIIIILALIILGGLYFWGRQANDYDEVNNVVEQEEGDAEIDSFQAELNAAETDSYLMEAETGIDAEFESAL